MKFISQVLLVILTLLLSYVHSIGAPRIAYYGFDYSDLGSDERDFALFNGPEGPKAYLNNWSFGFLSEDFNLFKPSYGDLIQEVPSDVLLMIVSLGGDTVQEFTYKGIGQKFFGIRGDLQLVDPMTGATLSSISNFYYRSHWDTEGFYRDEKGFKAHEVPYFKEDLNSGRLIRVVDGNSQPGSLSEMDIFEELIKLAGKQLLEEFITSFKIHLIEAETVREIDKMWLVNKGRRDGIFINTLFYSESSEATLKVVETHENYCFCRQVNGDAKPSKWESFRAYISPSGNSSSDVLLGVSRILYSPLVLRDKELGEPFRRDNEFVAARLDQSQEGKLSDFSNAADLQAIYTKSLTDALSDAGKFRLGFPLAAMRNLSRAKANMLEAMNLKVSEGGVPFEESLVMPDFGIAAVVSTIDKVDKIVDYVTKSDYSAVIDLYIYDLVSYEVIASSSTFVIKSLTYAVERTFDDQIFMQDLITDGLKLASKDLVENYNPISLTVELQGGGSELPLPEEVAPYVYEDQSFTRRQYLGDLELESATDVKFPILKNEGTVKIFRDSDGRLGISIDKPVVEKGEFKIRGVNEPPSNGRYSKSIGMKFPRNIDDTLDLYSYLLHSEFVNNPNYIAFIPEDILEDLDNFNRRKLLGDLLYREIGTARINNAEILPRSRKPSVYINLSVESSGVAIVGEIRAMNQLKINRNFKFVIKLIDSNTGNMLFKPITFSEEKTDLVSNKNFDLEEYKVEYLKGLFKKIVGIYYNRKLQNIGKQDEV